MGPIESASRLHESGDLSVTVIAGHGLRNADGMAPHGTIDPGNLSDPYCVCEIQGKPHTRFFTAVAQDTLNPVWNHSQRITDYAFGDRIMFYVFDKDYGKEDDPLGWAVLESEDLQWQGFRGQLYLQGKRARYNSTIEVKVEVLPTRYRSWSPKPSNVSPTMRLR